MTQQESTQFSPLSWVNDCSTCCICCWCGGVNTKNQRSFPLLSWWMSSQLFVFWICQLNQEYSEREKKRSIYIARLRDGHGFTLESSGLTLGRGLDLLRLEGPRHCGLCGDRCSGLVGWPWKFSGTWHSQCCLSWAVKVPVVKLVTEGMDTANWFTDFHLGLADLDSEHPISGHNGLNIRISSSTFPSCINIKGPV